MKKPQSLSLQEQLQKSGLVNDAKAKQIKTEKRKQEKQQRNQGQIKVDELKLDLDQTRINQAERDRELNHLRKQAEDHKALTAQIRQLVELNRIAEDKDGIAYQFSDENKIKKVYVANTLREALIQGRAGIVRFNGGYEIVPVDIARKIQERDAGSLVLLNQENQLVASADDPYADFQIPDNLIW
jgi:uncharacterized protein YaiL (DUF2058 family)